MMDANNVMVVGNLVRDPKIFEMSSGHKVASFSVAVTKSWQTKSGETKEKVNFPNCKAWGKDAEFIGQYKKGDRVAVMGEIETGSYEKEGRRVYTTEILVNKIIPFAVSREELPPLPEETYPELGGSDEVTSSGAVDVEIPF